jgi:hypothetical protein
MDAKASDTRPGGIAGEEAVLLHMVRADLGPEACKLQLNFLVHYFMAFAIASHVC